MRHRVLVIDDHEMVREGLCKLLESEQDLELAGSGPDGRQAIELAIKLAPNVVLMDVAMKNLNGIEATRQIVHALPNTRVIALSMHAAPQFVSGMLEAGASAYILKESAFEELVKAIRLVLKGQSYLDPKITGVVIDDYTRHVRSGPKAVVASLTQREREIAQLIAEGRGTKEIARLLKVSAKTIETHRQHIMKKLKVSSIAELTKLAIREGLTELDD